MTAFFSPQFAIAGKKLWIPTLEIRKHILKTNDYHLNFASDF